MFAGNIALHCSCLDKAWAYHTALALEAAVVSMAVGMILDGDVLIESVHRLGSLDAGNFAEEVIGRYVLHILGPNAASLQPVHSDCQMKLGRQLAKLAWYVDASCSSSWKC